jgi:hypothetical protein
VQIPRCEPDRASGEENHGRARAALRIVLIPRFSSEQPVARSRRQPVPPGRSQENSLYDLLIAEIARARSEERICGIPGPQFARTRDKRLRESARVTTRVDAVSATPTRPRVASA